jgi:hypothetical protein
METKRSGRTRSLVFLQLPSPFEAIAETRRDPELTQCALQTSSARQEETLNEPKVFSGQLPPLQGFSPLRRELVVRPDPLLFSVKNPLFLQGFPSLFRRILPSLFRGYLKDLGMADAGERDFPPSPRLQREAPLYLPVNGERPLSVSP